MSERDIIVIERSRPGRDSVPAPPDWTTVKADVATLKTRPAITKLDDVPDVNAPSPSSGQVLRWNGTAWSPGTISDAVTGVTDTGSVDLTLSGTTLSAAVRYAGPGAADTAARSNHWHWTDTAHPVAIAPQGYMSSGTRTLASTSVTLLAGVNYLVEAEVALQMRGADPGAAYYRLELVINGNAKTTASGANGKWIVQGVPNDPKLNHAAPFMGSGTSIPIIARVHYDSGAGFYTDAGELTVTLRPDR